MNYVPVRGSRLTREQAQRYGSTIESLGLKRPEQMVDAARPEDSPLHDAFEWNDGVAAEAFRRQQAAYVLRSIEVEIVNVTPAIPPTVQVDIKPEPKQEVKTTRAYVHVPEVPGETEGQYLPFEVVRSNQDFLSQVVKAARRELEAWQKKYAEYLSYSTVLARVSEQISLALWDEEE